MCVNQKNLMLVHILGARNIPYSQFRQRYKEMRADIPVYLYDQNGGKSARAALFLKKKDYEQLFHLQGGFRQWTGRIKKQVSFHNKKPRVLLKTRVLFNYPII